MLQEFRREQFCPLLLVGEEELLLLAGVEELRSLLRVEDVDAVEDLDELAVRHAAVVSVWEFCLRSFDLAEAAQLVGLGGIPFCAHSLLFARCKDSCGSVGLGVELLGFEGIKELLVEVGLLVPVLAVGGSLLFGGVYTELVVDSFHYLLEPLLNRYCLRT